MIGLPGESYDPCSLSLAYLYTLEEAQMESRVRNRAILFLMNLMGLKQVRDVVEKVEEARAIALIGLGDLTGKLEDVVKTFNIEVGEAHTDFKPAPCEVDSLEHITLARLQRI